MFQALLRRRRAQLDETLGPAAASTGWCLCRRPQTRLFIPGKANASRGWSCWLGIWRWPWDARLFLLSRQIQHRLVSALSPSPHHHSVTLALPPVIKRPTAKKKATQPVSQQAGSPTHWNPLIGIALLRGLMMRLHTTNHNQAPIATLCIVPAQSMQLLQLQSSLVCVVAFVCQEYTSSLSTGDNFHAS